MVNDLEKIAAVVDSFKGHEEPSEVVNLTYKERVCESNYDVSSDNSSECYCICSDCDCTGNFCDDC
jgi:hypothetical protein